jgi:heme/copper-type cytochrome/quinol oxidase subunit 3
VSDDTFEGLVPRSSAAASTREAALASRSRIGRPVAWWGMVMLVASEATLFGCLIGTYFFFRFESEHWPPEGVARPALVVPLVLAATLALSGGPMLLAVRVARGARVGAARLLLLAALVVQAGYFAYQVHDFRSQLEGLTPQTDAYGSIYYVLLGADHGHVAVGLLLDLWLLAKLTRGLTTYRLNALQAIAVYWYAVLTLTVVVTLTLVSPRL